MAFGQLTDRESLSDTILCIHANSRKLYHLGIGSAISKSTLSKANENRDWRIYKDFALLLIAQAKVLYEGDNQLENDFKNNVFLTNNFELKALEIALLYKHRWFIETFFKWIKQHLKIKTFWGTSPNAVKTQIWIAISVYVIVLILKKKLKLTQSIYEIPQILRINIFDKDSICQLFSNSNLQYFKEQNYNQLKLFDL